MSPFRARPVNFYPENSRQSRRPQLRCGPYDLSHASSNRQGESRPTERRFPLTRKRWCDRHRDTGPQRTDAYAVHPDGSARQYLVCLFGVLRLARDASGSGTNPDRDKQAEDRDRQRGQRSAGPSEVCWILGYDADQGQRETGQHGGSTTVARPAATSWHSRSAEPRNRRQCSFSDSWWRSSSPESRLRFSLNFRRRLCALKPETTRESPSHRNMTSRTCAARWPKSARIRKRDTAVRLSARG